MAAAMRKQLIEYIEANGGFEDSEKLCEEKGWDHETLVGAIKSLQSEEQITAEASKREGWKLTAEGEEYCRSGSPEVQVFDFVKAKGSVPSSELDAALGAMAKIGLGTCMKNKWVSIDKAKVCTCSVDSVTDTVRQELGSLSTLDKAKLDALKKRKLIAPTSLTAFKVEKTGKFSSGAQKAVADLTSEMISKGTWASTTFKPFNLTNAKGTVSEGGHLHPLNKVKTEMRQVLMQMGFEEMPTNQWVESSFWNFDALFQPQQHPARDAHDTFFMEAPSRAQNIPEDYLRRVKEMHEKGGQGSIGWRYDWSEDEAKKTLLRTHTTAVSARMLYKMGEEYRKTGVFQPKKYFSIDRVFRNETLDATHLAEFHQIEGFVADRNIGLPQLIGVLRDFFSRIGISKLRFKPAYNPYTEPSMEVFGPLALAGYVSKRGHLTCRSSIWFFHQAKTKPSQWSGG
ncbi:unnamed protein product [Effrenium voratum]|uniref:phenylalanine--tRNA ligase n=1 Tax=Effrenium voratum TaxID=2562239 RepID=A0AA36HNZ0_9DINO|nr:unnamed protein product [Effrenium voratum]